MVTYQIAPGTTDVSVVVRIVDSTDGTPETGVVFNTSGIDLEYRREGAVSTDITEATLSALTDAHSDGGFLHIGNGYYRLDLPDAACATGSSGCLVHGTVTGMVVIGCYIQLEAAVNKIYSDTTIIYSDTTIATSKTTQIYSDTAITSSKAVQIYSDTTIIYSDTTRIHSDTVILTAPNDGTAGAYYEWGIIDQGTAQSATATTLVLRAAAAFADDEIIGATIVITGGTTGVGQSRLVTDYVSATDTATVDTWTTTPSGTITYKIFGSASSSSALSAAQDSKLTRINSKSTQIYSDTAIIYSDTTIIYSDTTIATSKTTQIYSDTTIIASKSVQIYSDTTAIAAAGGSLTAAQDSKLTRVNSKSTQIYSDTAIIYSDTTIATSKTTQIYSDTAIASSKAVQVYSDTTIAVSKSTQIYSDTAITSSKAVQVYSDTTLVTAGVNVTSVNSVTIDGTGTEADPWGPV